jgi:hypothetical protein
MVYRYVCRKSAKGKKVAKRRFDVNYKDRDMARALDQLAKFDEFNREIAPALRDSVLKKESPKDIYKKILPYAAARLATIALTEKDPAKALSALKDILDRVEGKATENKKIEMAIENLSDAELDAKLASLEAAEEEEKLQ